MPDYLAIEWEHAHVCGVLAHVSPGRVRVTRTFVIRLPHDGLLIITITSRCGHIHVHITYREHFLWRFGDGPNQSSDGEVNSDVPNGTHAITVTIGGVTHTVPISD